MGINKHASAAVNRMKAADYAASRKDKENPATLMICCILNVARMRSRAFAMRVGAGSRLDMDMSGDFTFDTPKHYTTKIESKGSRSMGGRTTIERTATARVQAHGESKSLHTRQKVRSQT